MVESQTKSISGRKLLEEKCVNINFSLDQGELLFITGRIYGPGGIYLPKCAVVVFRVDQKVVPYKRIYLGVTFCDELGYYGFSIYNEPGCSYILKAYCYIE